MFLPLCISIWVCLSVPLLAPWSVYARPSSSCDYLYLWPIEYVILPVDSLGYWIFYMFLKSQMISIPHVEIDPPKAFYMNGTDVAQSSSSNILPFYRMSCHLSYFYLFLFLVCDFCLCVQHFLAFLYLNLPKFFKGSPLI